MKEPAVGFMQQRYCVFPMSFTVIFTRVGSEARGSPQGYAVSVGHFTHFAFTVNFTHYVKTKPDSVFTLKSRTLPTRTQGDPWDEG